MEMEHESLLSELPDLLPNRTRVAEFEIAYSRRAVTNNFELLGEDGKIIHKGLLKPPQRLGLGIAFASHGHVIGNPRVLVPDQARFVRLSIRYSPHSPRQRSFMFFNEIGLYRRFPKISTWISQLLPNTESWREHSVTIALPAPEDLQSETANAKQ